MRELNPQQRPSWLLGKLMNALEKKRQAKGLGWSRAWNKYGLTVFRTHTQRPLEDADYFAPLLPLLSDYLTEAPEKIRAFAAELLADPSRLAFIWYHNNDDETGQDEGLTVSIGCKVATDPSKRDRLDIMLEDARLDGAVDGLVDRVRIYVCPWSADHNGQEFFLLERTDLPAADLRLAQDCSQNLVAHYHRWKANETRQWSHWSARYIDYFGPRSFIPQKSSFV
jgi:hypothetical protein